MATIREQIVEARTHEQITAEQLALLAQLHPQTIYRLAAKGKIPGVVRYGRTIRFIRIVACGWIGQRRPADQMPA